MKLRPQLTALVLSSAALARAEIVMVDISEWPSAEETVTPGGWTVKGIDLYKEDKGMTFNATGDYAISPTYQGYVTQLVVSVCSTQPYLQRNLRATPVSAAAEARPWTLECTPEAKYAEQSFSWRVAEKVRQFRLQIEGARTGNWRVRSLAVCLDRVEPPQELAEDNRYCDALPVAWTSESRAVSYQVEASEVITVLPSFDRLKEWDFSSLTNTSGNTRNFADLESPESLNDVTGSELCLQAWCGGHLQVGKRDTGGRMGLRLPAAKGRSALMTLYKNGADADSEVDVFAVSVEGVTNALARPLLTEEPTVCAVSMPDGAVSLVLESRPRHRIRVRDVKIVAAYVPGSVTTNVVSSARTSGNGTVVRRLAPGDWLWHVRSYDREGFRSPWSPYRAVTLEAENPPVDRTGVMVIIR